MKHVTISEARDELARLVESPEDTLITKSGKPVSVLVSFELYRSMRATLRLLRDPEKMARILTNHVKIQRGELEDLISYDDLVAEIEKANAVSR